MLPPMARGAVERLYALLDDLVTGRTTVDRFCSAYETTYNWDVEEVDLTRAEAESFGRLFDAVVLYSPFQDDRRSYSGYRSDHDILVAAKEARLASQKDHRQGN